MCRLRGKSGFSLVELLTVIGIIAVLAAIIFPVMGSVKEQARKNNCMTNLRQIALGAKMYKTAQGSFPESLGPLVARDGGGLVIPCDSVRNDANALYPGEVNNIANFHCLSDPNDAKNVIGADSVTGATGYAYDSYDSYAKEFTVVQQYKLNWSSVSTLDDTQSPVDGLKLEPFPRGTDSVAKCQDDYARQLKWRTPPDNTVVAWCMFHSTDPYTDKTKGVAIVAFLDGHTEIHQAMDVAKCMWRIRPKG